MSYLGLLVIIWAAVFIWNHFLVNLVCHFSFIKLQLFAPVSELLSYLNLRVIQLCFYSLYLFYIFVFVLGFFSWFPRLLNSFLLIVVNSLSSSYNFLRKFCFVLGLIWLFLYLVLISCFTFYACIYLRGLVFETVLSGLVEIFLPLAFALNEIDSEALQPIEDSKEIKKAPAWPRLWESFDGTLHLKNLPVTHSVVGHLKFYDISINFNQVHLPEDWWVIRKYHHPIHTFWQVTQFIYGAEIPKISTEVSIEKILTSNLPSLAPPQVHPQLWMVWGTLMEIKKQIHDIQFVHIEHAFSHDVTLTNNSKFLVFQPTYMLVFLNDSGHTRVAYAKDFSLKSDLPGVPIAIEEFATRYEADLFVSKFAARLRVESLDFSRFVPTTTF